jgi:DNA-binding NarL/FixJ family response regulator
VTVPRTAEREPRGSELLAHPRGHRNLRIRASPSWFVLTRRESEVLDFLADGLTNAEIAARLYVSMKTVDTHVGNILSKLGVRNRREAVARAQRYGSQAP